MKFFILTEKKWADGIRMVYNDIINDTSKKLEGITNVITLNQEVIKLQSEISTLKIDKSQGTEFKNYNLYVTSKNSTVGYGPVTKKEAKEIVKRYNRDYPYLVAWWKESTSKYPKHIKI